MRCDISFNVLKQLAISFPSEGRDPWINILYKDLANSLISEEIFEITIENVSCCDWDVPNSRFLCSLPSGQGLTENDSTYIKRSIFFRGGGVRLCPLKIDTSVDEDIECQSQYQIRKGSIKGLKNEKAKWHRKIYLTGPFYFNAILRPCFRFFVVQLSFASSESVELNSFVYGVKIYFNLNSQGKWKIKFFSRRPSTFRFWEMKL